MTNVQQVEATVDRKTRRSVYDTDLHHSWEKPPDLLPYIPAEYRDRWTDRGMDTPIVHISSNGGKHGVRNDLPEVMRARNGGAALSADFACDHLLDPCGIDWALLTGASIATLTYQPDEDYANALAQAFNDFTVDRWLEEDRRFRGGVVVNQRDPEVAAREIDRIARHDAVVAAMFQGGATSPYGQRVYRPIHEACVRNDLVWAIHFGSEGKGINPAPTAAGHFSYYGESRINRAASYKAHLASFVFEGVFERYPTFKVAMLEAGFSWVGPFLWSMDEVWKETRKQVPWVKKPPSEYVIEQVRFASQPEDEPRPADGLEKILKWMHADRTLMFASDFPHWDWDDPEESFKLLPVTLQERIFTANAREFFRT